MARILLIRHGKAAASFTDDQDPGLDSLGQAQAEQVAEQLKARSHLKLISSPLKRARETAMPLANLLNQEISIEERVSEIPSPGLSLEERGPWLSEIMLGNWSEQSPELAAWREALVDCLINQEEDCAIFSHYVAINVAVGWTEGIDRVLVFRPDNTSVTEFETDGHNLILLERGSEAVTVVN